MKPLTFFATLVAALQLSTSSALAAGDWTWPVRGRVITQYRNGSDPYAAGQHRGIDIAAAVGDPVVAAAAGKVTFAGVAGSSGLTVSIRTADARFDTSYLHLSSTAVRAGESVSVGKRIGAVGTSGRRSAEQPHLHFGVREAGQRQAYRDPLDFLAPPPAADPRPAPAPRPAPVPVPSRAPIPVPAVVAAPAPAVPAGQTAPAPRALGSHTPAARAPAAPPSHRHAPSARQATPASRAALAAPAAGVRALPRSRADLNRPHGVHRAAPARRPQHVELGGAPRSPGLTTESAPRGAAPRPAPAGKRDSGGLDPGWLIACLGLVAAACALGRPNGAKASAVKARAAFASLLRG
jgi:hypothetical protein